MTFPRKVDFLLVRYSKTDADLNQAYNGSEKKSVTGEITFLSRLSELPSQKNKALQKSRKAAAEFKPDS